MRPRINTGLIPENCGLCWPLYSKYCIHPKYWDVLSIYHTCPKILNSHLDVSKMLLYVWQNSVDPDQTMHSAASDQGLNCLQKPVCPKTLSLLVAYQDAL